MARTTTAPGGRAARFPFPFTSDGYRYAVNVEPARAPVRTAAGGWGETVVDVDDDYRAELAERARILAADPTRCTVLPHMRAASWDALLYLLRELAAGHAGVMALTDLGGGRMSWRNDLLGVDLAFTVGDDTGVPGGPLAFAGSQVQEDIVLLDQREDALWADAGLVTFAADWSLNFDVGMSFLEVHGPVPRVHATGVVPRAQAFLMRLAPGREYRRTNWTVTAGHRLDTSTEAYPEWGRERALAAASPETLGDTLHLRVEVQHLLRLAPSGAVLFLIRTHLLGLREVARVPEWRHRFAAVLTELPDDLVDYKGLSRYRDGIVAWLAAAGGSHRVDDEADVGEVVERAEQEEQHAGDRPAPQEHLGEAGAAPAEGEREEHRAEADEEVQQ
ncbi:uncharacterized protein DUF3445 [Actinocorallia herbida]|uniref:Uncharacterized protein DUF3445 n=1 Tax=Actinocorallia herbida TaxID=58109 RepID=A0A3N1CY56_9ACTN|nr:uncharacterized protein DUF3445 [Actinocorallia herbida]